MFLVGFLIGFFIGAIVGDCIYALPSLGIVMDKPCTHCGKCCAAIPCGIGLTLLGDHRPCRALERDSHGLFWCGLVRHPQKFIRKGKNLRWKREFIASVVKEYNMMGEGCDRSAIGDATRKDILNAFRGKRKCA